MIKVLGLQFFFTNYPMPTFLLVSHSLSLSWFCLSNQPLVIADQAGGTAVNGERYNFDGTQQVRSTYGEQNPDSIKLFAIALARDAFLWDTGFAVTYADEYARLQREEPHLISHFNLPHRP